jgi:ribose 5-phosphate isomerase B
MRLAVTSDSVTHITEAVSAHLESRGHELVRCGALAGKSADYVDATREAAEKVAAGECEGGVFFCNTGTGVSIVANKIPRVRAALCVDVYSAQISRLANNANVLVLSMRYTGEGLAKEIVDAWLETAPSEEPRRRAFHRKTDELDAHYRAGGAG